MVLDLNLPDIDALDGLARRMGQTAAPVIVISSMTDGHLVSQVIRADAACDVPKHCRAGTLLVPNLSRYEVQALIDRMIQNRSAMAKDAPGCEHEVTFVMTDGLSTREDAVASK